MAKTQITGNQIKDTDITVLDIADGAVSLAKMANLAANSLIGNNTGSSAVPVALSIAQAQSMLSVSVPGISPENTLANYNLSGTTWTTLVGSAIYNVTTIQFYNTGSVTCKFGFKLVRSGTDYLVIEKNLAKNELFVWQIPFVLDANTIIQCRTNNASGAGQVDIGYRTATTGGTALAAFVGTNFTDVLTVPGGKTYTVKSIVISNLDTGMRDLIFQITDGTNVIFGPVTRNTYSSGGWYVHELPHVLATGWKIQVKASASINITVAITYQED